MNDVQPKLGFVKELTHLLDTGEFEEARLWIGDANEHDAQNLVGHSALFWLNAPETRYRNSAYRALINFPEGLHPTHVKTVMHHAEKHETTVSGKFLLTLLGLVTGYVSPRESQSRIQQLGVDTIPLDIKADYHEHGYGALVGPL